MDLLGEYNSLLREETRVVANGIHWNNRRELIVNFIDVTITTRRETSPVYELGSIRPIKVSGRNMTEIYFTLRDELDNPQSVDMVMVNGEVWRVTFKEYVYLNGAVPLYAYTYYANTRMLRRNHIEDEDT